MGYDLSPAMRAGMMNFSPFDICPLSLGFLLQFRRNANTVLPFAIGFLTFLCGSAALQCNTVNSCFFGKHFATYVGRPLPPI
jgi:hypothetical protein